MIKSKENDLMLNILANPHMTVEDFLSVGLNGDNTSLEDEKTYLNSEIITSNPMFLNEDGDFDKVEFHKMYLKASKALEMLTSSKPEGFEPTYSKYNIFAPADKVDFNPQFDLVKVLNPDRLTRSMITLGQSGLRTMTPEEIALSLKIKDSVTGKLMDSPEDLFSFNKLFSDFTGFFSDNFGSTKVLAQYETDVDYNGFLRGEAGFNENLIEHYAGDYMLNENGTYFYRTLKPGENIYGKKVLHYSDILTREGSALNSIDFLDSDDIKKSPFGSFVKNAALIGSFFLPGKVGQTIAGATIFQQSLSLGSTLGKIATLDSNNSTMNTIEGLMEATTPIRTRSEYSQQNNWTYENLFGLVGDVVAQLRQQRLLFKYSPVIFKGKWGINEKTLKQLLDKIIADLAKESKPLLSEASSVEGLAKAATTLQMINAGKAARQVEEYMKLYYKYGEVLSKAYMTLLTVNDIYGEAIEAGADNFDAAAITVGYAAMEYRLLSTDIGKWILPELRASRLENKAVKKALTKPILETFDKLKKEARKSEAAQRTRLGKLVDFGKKIAKGEFASGFGKRASTQGGEGLFAGGISSIFAGASAEAIEETSEELLADFSRVLFNGLEQLRGTDVRLKPFDNFLDRYAMSFLGGFIGGGISSYSEDFSNVRTLSNMNYQQAMQKVIYMARNNELGELYKLIDSEKIGNDKLSAINTEVDEQGNVIWKQGDEKDNQDLAIKTALKRMLNLVQNTLDAHGGKSNNELLDEATMRDIRYRVLHDSVTAGRYLQHYNELLTDLVGKTIELQGLSSPDVKAVANEHDLKDEKSPVLEEKRKRIENEIKELDEKINDFNEGKLAPLFMTSALLETTPFIAKAFFTSAFKFFAEKKAGVSFDLIPENELEKLQEDYANYLRTEKKDDLQQATDDYLKLLGLIRDNFQLARDVVAKMLDDDVIVKNIQDISENLLNFINVEGNPDLWMEQLLEYAKSANIGDSFLKILNEQIPLLQNTYNENVAQLEELRNTQLQVLEEGLKNGNLDEETYNNSVNKLNQDYQSGLLQLNNTLSKAKSDLILKGSLASAKELAEHIIGLGYMNGALRTQVLNKLLSAIKAANNQSATLLEDEMLDDNILDLITQLDEYVSEMENNIKKIKELPYTPILLNLDSFALSANKTNISGLLNELGKQINSNRGNLSAFTLQNDVYRQLNEALRVIDLYIAALEGARVDTVDPFNISPNGEDKSNVWGINRVLNEIHAKSPKLDKDDPWQDLPEIEGEIADMMIEDAKSIKSLLNVYKNLYNYNEGQKLNVQTRVATKTTYLLFERINRLLAHVKLSLDFDTSKLEKVLLSLTLLLREATKDKNDWNINLNQEEQTELEKERILMEDAIYEFFNSDNPELLTVEKLKNFFDKNFKLLDRRTELLTEGATDIDETSFIGYLCAKAAIKSSSFYFKFKEIFDNKIAPIISQELGVALQVANVINGNVVTTFNNAYREILIEQFKNASFEKRVSFLKEFGEEAPELFATEEGSKYFPSHDAVPQYNNITFIDGIPGAGKSAAVDALVIKFLLKYFKDTLSNAWVCHAGDTKNGNPFTNKLIKDIGLPEAKGFSKKELLEKISVDRKIDSELTNEDFKFENGLLTPIWKINNVEDLPSVIIIDEAQQFTQLDLLLINKFATLHGIPVIMSGDLQQSKATASFKLPIETVLNINKELKRNGVEILYDEKNTGLTVSMARNQTLHTPKLGTSMRTANNLKNANLAMMQLVLTGQTNEIQLHSFEDDLTLVGDILVNPKNFDEITRLIDKIISIGPAEGKIINYAYTAKDSEIVRKLKSIKKYESRINFIEGTALGQEGDYWIFEPKYRVDNGLASVNAGEYLADLYTGISRSRQASIVISPETLNGNISISQIHDLETHKIEYSPDAVAKYSKKRKELLDKILENADDIKYEPRTSLSTNVALQKTATSTPKEFLSAVEARKKELEDNPENPYLVGTFIDIYTEDGKLQENLQYEITEIKEGVATLKNLVNQTVMTIKVEDFNPNIHKIIEFYAPEEESENLQAPINELDVSNETLTKNELEDATLDDNTKEEDVEPVGLSLKDFMFFVFTNSTFELGTTELDYANDTFRVTSPYRIDGLNGLKNCPRFSNTTSLRTAEKILSTVRKILLNTRDKSEACKLIYQYLIENSDNATGDNLYIRFGIKTSELKPVPSSSPEFETYEKDAREPLPYCRAQSNKNSESNFVNRRNLVAIIGLDSDNGGKDLIEIPLLALNNPITLLNIHDSQGNYKFPDVAKVYQNALANASGSNGERQIEALIEVLKYTNNRPEYKGLENLIKLYIRTDRNMLFVDDINWMPSKNLHSFGPQLHIHRGMDYLNPDYIQEQMWIPLNDLRKDPTISVTKVYQLVDKSGQTTTSDGTTVSLALPKHPFVLYTDACYDHNGNRMISDAQIINEFLYLKLNPNVTQTIKLVYVLPPKFTLKQYVDSLKKFMEEDPSIPVLGNQRTAYKIFETIFMLNPNLVKAMFIKAFGESTGTNIYNKILDLIINIKDLPIEVLMKELHKVKRWENFNGVGLTTQVPIYRHLQHIIKQLVYPGGVTIEGTIKLKSLGYTNYEVLNQLTQLFESSGKSLFYQTRASKTSTDLIEGIFSPVLTDSNGNISDPNIGVGHFSINGNISSSTFLTNEEFNNMLDYMVNVKQNLIPNRNGTTGNKVGSQDNRAYANHQSGFGKRVNRTPKPSIDASIQRKLDTFGIKLENVNPLLENDNSITLKNAIANEINSKRGPIRAIVLGNELLIGKDNLFDGQEVSFNFGSNSFESGLLYQFEVKIGNKTYNAVYVNNEMTLTEPDSVDLQANTNTEFSRQLEELLNSDINQEFVSANRDNIINLLLKLSALDLVNLGVDSYISDAIAELITQYLSQSDLQLLDENLIELLNDDDARMELSIISFGEEETDDTLTNENLSCVNIKIKFV